MKGIGRNILAALACGVVLLTGLAGCSGSNSPNGVVTAFANAISTHGTNPEALEQAMRELFPEAVLNEQHPAGSEDNFSQILQNAAETNQQIVDAMNDATNGNWEYRCEVTSSVQLSDPYSNGDNTATWIITNQNGSWQTTDDMETDFQDVMGFSDFYYTNLGLKVEERQAVVLAAYASANGESEVSDEAFYIAVKINGKWYLDLYRTGMISGKLFPLVDTLWPSDFRSQWMSTVLDYVQ